MTKQVARFNVEGMSCQHCVNSIKRAVGDLKGVDSVEVDLQGKTVTVGFDPQGLTEQNIKEAIEDQGYDVV